MLKYYFRSIVKYMIILHYQNCYKNNLPFFFTKYKNEWKERKFWRQKVEKSVFYKNKKVTSIDDIDANKILVSKEES